MTLWVEQRGDPDKPEMVMLHGWGMNSDVWGDFAEQLAQHFHITLIDLPGLGRSTDLPEPYTSHTVAEQLQAVVPEQAIWLGWSMGGQIALAFAACYPNRVSKLITLASNPCFVQRADWRCAMDEQTHSQFERALADNEAKTLLRFIMLQTQGAAQGKEILKRLKALLQSVNHTAALTSLAPLREDLRPQLSLLKMPLLQLFAEKDLLVPVAAAAACEAISGQAVRVYPEAGHLPFLSHQQEVVNDLLAFCEVEH